MFLSEISLSVQVLNSSASVQITTNKESYYPYLHHRTLRRYNEFKDFADDLTVEMARHNIYMQLPPIPDASFIGRKSKDTIKQRMLAFQEYADDNIFPGPLLRVWLTLSFFRLMNACARAPICDLPCIFKFLGIRAHRGGWRFIQYVNQAEPTAASSSSSAMSPKYKQRTL